MSFAGLPAVLRIMNNLERKENVNIGVAELAMLGNTSTLQVRRLSEAGYRLAIFDFDGTLADSFSWFLGVINEIADTHGFRRIEDHELAKLRGYDTRRMLDHVGIPMWKMPLLQRHLRKRMAQDISRIELFPGVVELLEGLTDRGIALAIVTSNSFANVRQILGAKNAGLIQHFSCGAPVLGKRAKLNKVLHSCRVGPSQAIFIGDEIRDLHAARAVGIAFGAVAWGVNNMESLSGYCPDELFFSIDEIAARIARPRSTAPIPEITRIETHLYS